MKKKKFSIVILVMFALVILGATKAYAAPNTIPIPKINVSVDQANSPKDYVDNIKLLIMLTVIS